MVKEYLFSNGDVQLSEHFMLHEAKCPDSDSVLVSEELVAKVEELRKIVPNCATIELSSGYRTPDYSVSVGGGASDQHTKGNAWDLACFDGDHNVIDGKIVACKAQDLGFSGIGYMGNYVHIDVGNRHWFGDEQTGKNIPNDDFYSYFGIARESAPNQEQSEPIQQDISKFREAVIFTYAKYLNRLPQESEITYWVDRIVGGEALEQAVTEIANSTEENEDAGTRNLYKLLLFRTDDKITEDELKYWRGFSDSDKVKGIMNSDEYRACH